MLNGTVNRHNCRYWADENPHWMREAHTQYAKKVNVWAGIINNKFKFNITSRTSAKLNITTNKNTP